MAAGFRALGDDAVHPVPGQPSGQDGGRYHGEHLDPGLLPGGDILAGVARSGGHYLYLLLGDDLSHLIGGRIHQHQVDAEGLVREGAAQADLLPQFLRLPDAAGGDDSQGARV